MKAFNELKQRNVFIQTLRICMTRKGYYTWTELAPHIPMDRNVLCSRVNWRAKWTLQELWRLFRAVGAMPEEINIMMGAGI